MFAFSKNCDPTELQQISMQAKNEEQVTL